MGSREELDQVLLKSGLAQAEITDLTTAIKADKSSMGNNVRTWIKQNSPRVLASGMKIGTEIGQKLLTEWLKQYFGLT